ncbi:MAG: hypothetical protein HOO96_37665 [Polyangiaceae bacterium]|nr:hypothetical protein [Polyangiaceae bacterium]
MNDLGGPFIHHLVERLVAAEVHRAIGVGGLQHEGRGLPEVCSIFGARAQKRDAHGLDLRGLREKVKCYSRKVMSAVACRCALGFPIFARPRAKGVASCLPRRGQ